MAARCSFYVLNREDPDDSQAIYPKTPSGGLILDHPPAVGDLIWLSGISYRTDDEGEDVSGCWRVLARSWSPAVYGSQAWPAGTERETGPVWLDLMVEPAEGLLSPANWPQPPAEGGQQ